MSWYWIIIIGAVLIGAYYNVPSFHDAVAPYVGKWGDAGVDGVIGVVNDSINNNGVVESSSVNESLYSVVGYPSKLSEFSCLFDRDCNLYVDSCNGNCVCLENGECAIRVV